MDFSILYRILWKPREVLKEFEGKLRLEPFIFIGVLILLSAMNAYRSYSDEFNKQPSLLIAVLMQISIGSMIIPTVNATLVYLVARPVRKLKVSFMALVSAFILCGIPYYLETTMNVFGYRSIGLGTLASFLKSSQPFLFGMIATLTLFFAWTIYLWWVAMDQFSSLRRWQNTLLVCSLALIHMLIGGGIWRLASLFISNQ